MSDLLLKARRELRAVLVTIPDTLVPVVALSGGADSFALAYVAHLEGVKNVHIIDHGLQEVTAEVSARMAALTQSWGMNARVTRVNVSQGASMVTGGTENAARDARYESLLEDENAAVLLAHTMRDQAETVLMGFGRGSGPRSIAGMPVHRGRIYRPFLNLKREETEQICVENDLPFWNDPHNDVSDYRRVRVRKELLPLMEDILDGGVEESLCRTASMLQAQVAFVDGIVEESFTTNTDDLLALDELIRRQVIRLFLLESGVVSSRLTSHHILGVEKLIVDWHGQKHILVPGGVVKRVGKVLLFVPHQK